MAELNIEQLEVVGVEQRQEGGGIFSSNTVTVYVIDIVSSIGQVRRHTHDIMFTGCEIGVCVGQAAGRAVGDSGVRRQRVYRRYSDFEQLHSEVLSLSERGRYGTPTPHAAGAF